MSVPLQPYVLFDGADSSRIARLEEEEALEAERIHEQEKRRKKIDKEMRDRRG